MFPRTTILWSLLVVLGAGLLGWWLLRPTSLEAPLEPQERLVSVRPSLRDSVYTQTRDHMRRDLFLPKEERRQHAVQVSHGAKLEVDRTTGSLTEQLRVPRCWLYRGEQALCSIEAPAAMVDLREGTLAAQEVRLVHLRGWQVRAQALEYEENELTLTGQVAMEDGEGTLLQCQRAVIDVTAGKGLFEGAPVTVQGTVLDDHGVAVPVQFLCRLGKVTVDDDGVVTALEAEGGAAVTYGSCWRAEGSVARYQRSLEAGKEMVCGVIELSAGEEGSCAVSHVDGSRVDAAHMSLDTATQAISLVDVQGLICPREAKQIQIAAESALWDPNARVMTLRGDVEITWGDEERLSTDDEVRIFCSAGDRELSAERVESRGNTRMAFGGGTLCCQGLCQADLRRQLLTFRQDPESGQSIVSTGPQGELTCQAMTIAYVKEQGRMVPSHLVAENQVRLKRPVDGTYYQHALCDELVVTSRGKEMLFKSGSGRRALFFDERYDVKISAPAVQLDHDGQGKERVKGLGDVRLRFAENELALIRTRKKKSEEE